MNDEQLATRLVDRSLAMARSGAVEKDAVQNVRMSRLRAENERLRELVVQLTKMVVKNAIERH